MNDLEQDSVNSLWKKHRSKNGSFRVYNANVGLLVADMTTTPPRVWVGKVEDDLLKVRVADIPGGFVSPVGLDENHELMISRIWATTNSRELSPPEVAGLIGEIPGLESWAELSVRRFVESFQDINIRARLPVDKMKESENVRLAKAGVEHFKTLIDIEAMSVLSAVENYTWKEYKYYSIKGSAGSLDDLKRTVRHQAARAFPMLAGVFTARFGIKADLDKQAKFLLDRAPLKERMDIAKADSNETEISKIKILMDELPKPPALLESLDRAFTPSKTENNPNPKSIISKAALNRIAGISFIPKGLRPESVAMDMSELPPDWFPKKGSDWKYEEWTAFTDLIATVGLTLRRISGSKPEVLYEGCGGKWAETRDRIVKAFTDSRPPAGDDNVVEQIYNAIDWKELRSLPSLKVPAGAEEMASRIKDLLPDTITEKDVSDWIVRLISPPKTRDIIMNYCAETELAVSTLCNKVMLPLALTLTGDDNPFLTHDQFELGHEMSANILFGNKSAVKIFETLTVFHQNSAAILSGGTLLEHELERHNQELILRKLRKKENDEKIEQEKMKEIIGVDFNLKPEFPIAFSPVIIAPNGVHICTLSNREMFNDEGRGYCSPIEPDRSHEKNEDGSYGLNICVGYYNHYYDEAFRGNCTLFSARIPQGDDAHYDAPYTRLAVYKASQFTNNNGQWTANVLEYRGRNNGPTPEISDEAFRWFFEQVKLGNINHNLGEIDQKIKTQMLKVDRVEDICGYDWHEYPRIVAALESWMPVISKKNRISILDFSKLTEVQLLANSISPGWRQKSEMRDQTWGRNSYGLK